MRKNNFLVPFDIHSASAYFNSVTCPPSLHIPVLSRRENNLLVIKEAKRAHNLPAVCARQDNSIIVVERPSIIRRLCQEDELKVLLAKFSFSNTISHVHTILPEESIA